MKMMMIYDHINVSDDTKLSFKMIIHECLKYTMAYNDTADNLLFNKWVKKGDGTQPAIQPDLSIATYILNLQFHSGRYGKYELLEIIIPTKRGSGVIYMNTYKWCYGNIC